MVQVSVRAEIVSPVPTAPANPTALGAQRLATTPGTMSPPATRRTWRSSVHRGRPWTTWPPAAA